MILELIENKFIDETKMTIEYKEKDEDVKRIVEFVENIDINDNNFIGESEGKIYKLCINDVLYIESVDRRSFCYTLDGVYETGFKLYEIEEKYEIWDYMRISKSCIVNLKKIKSLKPDYGGKILATMDNGEKLYISRQYAPVLKKKLGLGGGR